MAKLNLIERKTHDVGPQVATRLASETDARQLPHSELGATGAEPNCASDSAAVDARLQTRVDLLRAALEVMARAFSSAVAETALELDDRLASQDATVELDGPTEQPRSMDTAPRSGEEILVRTVGGLRVMRFEAGMFVPADDDDEDGSAEILGTDLVGWWPLNS